MNMGTAIVAKAPRRRQERENPLGLFISVIRDNPQADQSLHRRNLRGLLLSPGYEDFLDAVVDEWQRIKYSTAYRAALPPTTKEIKERSARRNEAAAREEGAVKRAKALIGGRLLDFVMPNGKPLRNCTGAECTQAGGFFSKIGKRVGPDSIVGDVLSEIDIAAMAA